jgi:hypothetical protein
MITITPCTAPAACSAPSDDADPAAGATQADATPEQSRAGADPLAKLALNDLHPAAHSFAAFAPRDGSPAHTLAHYAPQAHRHGSANGSAAPLHQSTQAPGNAQVQPATAPSPAKPGAPIDLRRMEVLNAAVQRYRIDRSPVDPDDLRDTQRKFQAATDALKAGDYKKAEQVLGSLGFPLPAPGSGQRLSHNAAITAILLGVPVQGTRGGGWNMSHVTWGARGNQALNDVNGLAANAIMINRLASSPGGVSNPPSEAQVTRYMREFAQPAQGKPPTAQQIMQAASEITNGFIVHYSSAGAADPKYGSNPNQHAYYRDRTGQIHEFGSIAEAQQASRAGTPPVERGGKITPIIARSPDEWSDITSQGTRAGRHIGDCESKVYLQTRLLTEAGFASLGSVDVQLKDGSSGHMFGVFKAPDGTVWVTSNEEFRQVKASDAKAGVTQADLDSVLREMTAEIYHVQPNYKGELDLSDFRFATAATANLTGANAATDTIRRSTEMNALGRSDTLIAPPSADKVPKP